MSRDDLPFACPACDAVFETADERAQHQRTDHSWRLPREDGGLRLEARDLWPEGHATSLQPLASSPTIAAELARLQEQLTDVMRAGDLEHARMAALIEACEAASSYAMEYGDGSVYGRFRAYGEGLARAVAAVRPQAAALLAELNAARQLKDWTRKWQRGGHIISTQMIRAMDAMDEAVKARSE